MKAILKAVGKPPKVIEIENTLEALQKAVGGYIELVTVSDAVLMVCDEEGKLKGKAVNFSTKYDIIVGNVLFVQNGFNGEFSDLTDASIQEVMQLFE